MKIGIFTDSYLPQVDGVATSVTNCVQELKRRGHDVSVICPRHPAYKDKEKNVIRLRSFKVHSEPDFRIALQLPERSLLRAVRVNYDIIHGHSGGPVTFIGWQIAKLKNLPYVVTYHTRWSQYSHYFLKGKVIRPRMFEVFSRVFGNVSDNIIAPTHRVKSELLSYGVKKPIHVLPSGVNIAMYRKEKKDYLRKKIKATPDQKILLSVGRLSKEKSIDFLIKSFKHIHTRYPESLLVLIGQGSDKKNLTNLAKKLDIEQSVIFYGMVPHAEMPKVYKDADVFVFASKTETQGMVVYEALASGVPVVAVHDSTFKDVIVNGENGYMVKRSVTDFSKKVCELLEDDVLREKISRNAEKSAEQFSIKNVVDKLEAYYKVLIAEKEAKE